MSQTDVNLENCKNAILCANEIMEAFPKSKVLDFIGHFNDLLLFLSGVEKSLENPKNKHERIHSR